MGLQKYNQKRDFTKTKEPSGRSTKGKREKSKGLQLVVQEHHARRLHWDFRLELDGILLSWAVPKGPPTDPKEKRLAVHVEDHPIEYGKFHGTIPKGEYGAGKVKIWDRGTWEPIGDPRAGMKKGHLDFLLKGKKLKGHYSLVQMKRDRDDKNWLLIKHRHEPSMAVDTGSVTKLGKPASIRTSRKKKSAIKDFPEPQLPTLSAEPPEGKDWIHELKFDGYRTLCHKQGEKVTLWTRSGLNWTSKYSAIAEELKRIRVSEAWIDGEIVCVDDKGRSDFSLLQDSLTKNDSSRMIYYVFDLLEIDNQDLRSFPLLARKERLKEVIQQQKLERIVYSEHFSSTGQAMLGESCKHGLEGIISKQVASPYSHGRGRSWLKSKCANGQEFVIGGYTTNKEGEGGLGALLVGTYDEERKLQYAGRVGTGFTNTMARDLLSRFKELKANKSPFEVVNAPTKGVQWLQPRLLAEVHFRGWTRDKVIRQAAFKGLRFDKSVKEVKLDVPIVKLTHPEKVLVKKGHVSKRQIWEYYEAISGLMLPELIERPLSLLRCPDGIAKQCFFQKKLSDQSQPSLKEQKIKSPKGSTEKVIFLEDAEGLMALAQLGVLEIHTWGTHIAHIDNPDMIVFDFDPGPGVELAQVRDAVIELRDLLDNLNLKSFLKISGGKGYHIHVPVEPLYTWDEIKSFTKVVVDQMAQRQPDKYLTTMTKSQRKGRIFLDYLRNGYGATAIAPYSLRAKDFAPVAVPIDWKDLKNIKPNEITIADAASFLKKRRKNPWQEIGDLRQKIDILDRAQAA